MASSVENAPALAARLSLSDFSFRVHQGIPGPVRKRKLTALLPEVGQMFSLQEKGWEAFWGSPDLGVYLLNVLTA